MRNWNEPENAIRYLRQQERRVAHQERRPQIRTASDLLGPGLAPRGVRILDWNDDVTTFNGIFYSEPGAINSPDPAQYWMGNSWADADGLFGFQEVTNYRASPDPTVAFVTFRRRFYDPGTGGLRTYTDWV